MSHWAKAWYKDNVFDVIILCWCLVPCLFYSFCHAVMTFFFSFLAGVFLFVHVLARPLRGDLVSTFDHVMKTLFALIGVCQKLLLPLCACPPSPPTPFLFLPHSTDAGTSVPTVSVFLFYDLAPPAGLYTASCNDIHSFNYHLFRTEISNFLKLNSSNSFLASLIHFFSAFIGIAIMSMSICSLFLYP